MEISHFHFAKMGARVGITSSMGCLAELAEVEGLESVSAVGAGGGLRADDEVDADCEVDAGGEIDADGDLGAECPEVLGDVAFEGDDEHSGLVDADVVVESVGDVQAAANSAAKDVPTVADGLVASGFVDDEGSLVRAKTLPGCEVLGTIETAGVVDCGSTMEVEGGIPPIVSESELNVA